MAESAIKYRHAKPKRLPLWAWPRVVRVEAGVNTWQEPGAVIYAGDPQRPTRAVVLSSAAEVEALIDALEKAYRRLSKEESRAPRPVLADVPPSASRLPKGTP